MGVLESSAMYPIGEHVLKLNDVFHSTKRPEADGHGGVHPKTSGNISRKGGRGEGLLAIKEHASSDSPQIATALPGPSVAFFSREECEEQDPGQSV